MRFFAVIILVLFTVAGCGNNDSKSGGNSGSGNGTLNHADFPNEDDTIFGAWVKTERERTDNGTEFIFRIYFNRNNQIGMEMDCEFVDGKVVTAVATVSGVIDQDEFSAQHAAEVTARDDVNGRSYSCTMQTLPADMKISYNISNDNLRLLLPNGRDFDLVRIR